MFAFNKEDNAWEPEHNPFTMPKPEFVDNFESCPEKALGDIWDLTMNGVELASGAIRVSNPEVQKRILEFIGITAEDAEKKFGFLMNAYKYGGPVHGGMGIGVDRLVAMMLGFADIREVIAFPKNKNAECPMDNSPNDIDDKQWKELGLEITKKK
jgi:aspartyl-tRNA synthetase